MTHPHIVSSVIILHRIHKRSDDVGTLNFNPTNNFPLQGPEGDNALPEEEADTKEKARTTEDSREIDLKERATTETILFKRRPTPNASEVGGVDPKRGVHGWAPAGQPGGREQGRGVLQDPTSSCFSSLQGRTRREVLRCVQCFRAVHISGRQ